MCVAIVDDSGPDVEGLVMAACRAMRSALADPLGTLGVVKNGHSLMHQGRQMISLDGRWIFLSRASNFLEPTDYR